jgi:hypothetical protein
MNSAKIELELYAMNRLSEADAASVPVPSQTTLKSGYTIR